VTRTYLYIAVTHKTADEMATQFGFNADQKQQLNELLSEDNKSLWAAMLYGISTSDTQIVSVALSQIGEVGGQPYWSWYGFGSRVEWCACFVSWCANECGYIDTGVIPKYAGCVNGVDCFKDRGQWLDGSTEPVTAYAQKNMLSDIMKSSVTVYLRIKKDAALTGGIFEYIIISISFFFRNSL
jgi:hypothetical protein